MVVWKWTWDRWLIKTKKLIKNCFPHQPDVYVIDITITTQCILEQLKKCRTIDNHKQETVKCREIQIWCYKSEHPPPPLSKKKLSPFLKHLCVNRWLKRTQFKICSMTNKKNPFYPIERKSQDKVIKMGI